MLTEGRYNLTESRYKLTEGRYKLAEACFNFFECYKSERGRLVRESFIFCTRGRDVRAPLEKIILATKLPRIPPVKLKFGRERVKLSIPMYSRRHSPKIFF